MDNQFLNPLRELKYAILSTEQESKLRDFEKQFNSDFGTEVYFMVMEKGQMHPGH